MVPAAGVDCASWILENMVERSGGSSAGSRPFPPPMSPAVHGLWVRMMPARWRGSQASRMRCGTSRTSSSPISAIVVTPRGMGVSGEYPATSATRKGGHPKLDSVLAQGALLNDIMASGHVGRFLPESLNGGCRSSKETSAKRRFQPLMTLPRHYAAG